jgi:hypothetical protein
MILVFQTQGDEDVRVSSYRISHGWRPEAALKDVVDEQGLDPKTLRAVILRNFEPPFYLDF